MVNIALEFTYHTDIISVPDRIGTKIRKYQNLFDKWLYDKNNNHGHWIIENGKPIAVSFDTSTFVEYLNKYHIDTPDEKAIIVEENSTNFPSSMTVIWF